MHTLQPAPDNKWCRPTTRQCGDCQLCCKLLPVPSVPTAAGERCRHQRFGKGCAIYHGRPAACRAWSCVWLLAGDGTRDLNRPDRVHYVVDPMPDFVKMTDNRTGEVTELPVHQIWMDAAHPDAHRDPALRAWLEASAKATGMAALVRVAGNEDAVGLFPPSMNSTGEWQEVQTNFRREDQHSAEDIARVMNASGLRAVITVAEG